jgi:hypothetical protein
MDIDETLDAMPRLVGAPAYARPPAPVQSAPRPFDPDELPLEIDQTEEERAFAAKLPARAFAPGGADVRIGAVSTDGTGADTEPATSTDAGSRSLSLRRITRFRGGRTSV